MEKMADKYLETAKEILALVGGKENIKTYEHCMTRLRLILIDDNKFEKEKIEQLDLVKGSFKSSGQFQIILGSGIVNKVYEEVRKLIGEVDTSIKDEVYNNMTTLQKITRLGADIFIPIIPIIIASGMFLGFQRMLNEYGILTPGSSAETLYLILSSTSFTFLPAFISWSTVKRFGGTPILGFISGLMLVSPMLPGAAAVAKGGAKPLIISLFSHNIEVVNFQSAVIPAILVGLVVVYVERKLNKVVPEAINIVVVPFLTMMAGFFSAILILGPIFSVVESGLVNIFRMFFSLPFGIGGFIIGGLQQVLVLTGLHHALWVIDTGFIANVPYINWYQPIRSASVLGQAGSLLAFALFSKARKTKALSISSFTGAVFGITEPGVFGVTLVYMKPFIFGLIGSAVGGWYSTLVNFGPIKGMGIAGLPGYLLFLGDPNMIHYTIVNILATLVPFILTTIWLKKQHLNGETI